MRGLLLIIICLLCLCCLCCSYSSSSSFLRLRPYEGYENLEKIPGSKKKWARSLNCAAYMNSTTYDCLKDNLIEQTSDPAEADIIFPCGYNNIENEIRSLPHLAKKGDNPKIVFIIEGADEISAKDKLWRNILKHYGLTKTLMICPKTYILIGEEREKDIQRLKSDHVEGKAYIVKKNLQRQEGLKIMTSLDDIIKNEGSYVLVQELLQDPYLLNGRKINLRVYIVVVCQNGYKNIYVFDNGFMYYTKKEFEAGDQSLDNNITTGYIDREVYIHNPLTLMEFRNYLDLTEGDHYHPNSRPRKLNDVERKIRNEGMRISDVTFDRILDLIRNIFVSLENCTCRPKINQSTENPIQNDCTVEIFGADIALDSKLEPLVMEINKGPDLNPKDDRDSKVKKSLMNAVFGLVGLTDLNNSDGLHLVLKTKI